jgi:hypothetical protein
LIWVEAELVLKKALEICEQQLGVDHPNTITVKENYEDFLRKDMVNSDLSTQPPTNRQNFIRIYKQRNA